MKPGDFGIRIGTMQNGPRNSICDVEGVLVGHFTLTEGRARTGVTAILPHRGNIFAEKVSAAAFVLNGFGKSAGLVQVAELGTLETPIALTNTLCVGRAFDALVEYSLERNPGIGVTTGTVNPVVGECNDGQLNDIRGMHVRVEHVRAAIGSASADFERGAVGAGTGMSCFGLKGGIGSASRIIPSSGEKGRPDGKNCIDGNGRAGVLGALVLSNFGLLPDLLVDGKPVGTRIAAAAASTATAAAATKIAAAAAKAPVSIEAVSPATDNAGADKGSIIIILATDLPLSDRQLGRVARRAVVGLARMGSHIGNGSGDIVIAFSTAQRVRADEARDAVPCTLWNENRLDPVFRAAAETVEEAILDSLLSARTMTGYDGLVRRSLAELTEFF